MVKKVTTKKTGLNILMIYADSPQEWNCSQWRNLTPASAFNRHQDSGWYGKLIHVSGFISGFMTDPVVQRAAYEADLIVFQRNIITPQALDAMRYWQAMGKPVVVDLDDWYGALPYSNPARRFWEEKEHPRPDGTIEKGGALRMMEEGLRISDGLIAPNRLLLQNFSYVASRGYYLQNYAEPFWWHGFPVDKAADITPEMVARQDRFGVDVGWPTRKELKKERGLEDKIVIGWGGSISHYDSFFGSGILEAAKNITRRHP